MSHPQRPDVISRLARIEGHVRAVKQMSEDGKPCAEILHQIAAVQAALRKVAQVVLEDHLDHCLAGVAQGEDGRKAMEDLKAALANYQR
jgi:CsoR family transcriptional regulator, copper-sensing transcriptional repressor